MSAWAHYGRQVSLFAVVGLASTLVHVAVFNLLVAWFAMPPLAANLAGFALAFGLSFSAHSGWTFSARQGAGSVSAPTQRGAELTKFFATALAGFALNSLIVFVTMDWAKLPSAAPSVLMVTVTPLFLFALNRFWVFSGRFVAEAGPETRPSLSAQARRDLRWLAVVGSATLLCLAPLFIPGELGKGGDARFHLVWQNALLRTWSWTSPYPRWMPDLVDGFGSPAFFIYPPVAHFVAGAFGLFLPETHHTELRLVLAVVLATVIGAAGFFAWMRERGLRRGAWAATALYTLAPYHIYVDLFHRGAFAELFAFAWAPWIFLAIGRLRSDPALAAPGLAISTALLLATHIPSSILLLPAAGLYAVLMHGRPGSWPALGLYAWSSFCGLLLAGFYLGTAVTHGAYIDTAALFGGRSESWRWLLGFASWPDTGIQKVVMIVAGLQTALLLGLLLDLWRERRLRETPLVLYAGLCGLAAFALMTQASAPVWHLQTILNKIQFPWRLLFVQTLAVALLIGVWAERSRWASLATPALVALLLGVNGSLLLYHDFVSPPSPLPSDLYAHYEAPEYRLGPTDELRRLFPGDTKAVFTTGQGEVHVERWEPRSIELSARVTQPGRLALRQFSYTGWEVRLDGQPIPTVADVKPGDLLWVALPTGEHRVEMQLVAMRSERLGWWASALGLVLLVATSALLAFRDGRLRARTT